MLPLIIRLEDTEKKTTQQLVFDTSPVRVGRNPLNELPLQDRFCSQWHGIVRFDAEGTSFMDLGSLNGTDCDGRVLKKGELVQVGPATDLRIGKTQLHFSRGKAEVSRVARKEWTVFGLKASSLNAEPSPTSPARGSPSAEDIGGLYREYRATFDAVKAALERQLEATASDRRAELVGSWLQSYPALQREPALGELVARFGLPNVMGDGGASPGGSGSTGSPFGGGWGGGDSVGAASKRLLETFARSYVTEGRSLEDPSDVQGFLGRLAEVLETYSSAFLELRRGHQQFANEIGVRSATDHSPLFRAKGASDVLKYLLDWKVGNSSRTQELMGGFVELMVHQVALLNGMREGVKSLLHKLSPEELERTVAMRRVKLGPLQLPAGVWPFKAGARWKGYREQHRTFVEEEQQLTAAVFGPDFARAYATVMSDSADAAPSPAANPASGASA